MSSLFRLFLAIGFILVAKGLAFSQFMLNGGFEDLDPSVNGFFIDNALHWNYVNGSTADLKEFGLDSRSGQNTGAFCFHHSSDNEEVNNYEPFYGETLNLTAGESYKFNAYIKPKIFRKVETHAASEFGSSIFVYFVKTIPTSYDQVKALTPTFEFQFLKQSGDYSLITDCFTAPSNGKYYVVFSGDYCSKDKNNEQLSCYFSIDDVSLTKETLSTPTLNITNTQSAYCVGNPIVWNGSQSSGVNAYSLKLCTVSGGTNESMFYNSGILAGGIGSLDIGAIILAKNRAQAGVCFRAYLTAYGECRDEKMIDFCYDDPVFSFLANNLPVCENTPLDLKVTGQNNWIYTWSNGQTGVGLKTINVSPTKSNNTYMVTVVTPAGCTSSKSYTYTVHSNIGQVAPSMDGINGTGEFVGYYRAGQYISFSSSISNNSGETVDASSIGIPTVASFPLPSNTSNGGVAFFQMPTNKNSTGEYVFTIKLKDNNVCQILSNEYKFTIRVVCPNCPICLDIDSRTPTNDPLISKIEAAKCLKVGFNEEVKIGDNQQVVFQAGQSIDFGAYFDSGKGSFDEIITPSTCVDDCDACCTNFTGFTYDPPLEDGFRIVFGDEDPTNDYFEFTDSQHPYCAFNAKGYHFVIGAQRLEYVNVYVSTDECCRFRSPSPENGVQHSPIYWDAHEINYFGNRVPVETNTYYYVIDFYGCNGEIEHFQGTFDVRNFSGRPTSSDSLFAQSADFKDIISENVINSDLLAKREQGMLGATNQINVLSSELILIPNPAVNQIEIVGLPINTSVEIQLYDEKGVLISSRKRIERNIFTITDLKSGTYFCKIFYRGKAVTKKFVKI